MKKDLLLALLILSLSATAQPYRPGKVVNCISGDCMNGIGEAKMTKISDFAGDVYYKGSFKNGIIDGEGTQVDDNFYYVGHFKEGNKNGYMTRFNVIWKDKKYYPDSSGEVAFAKYKTEFGFKSIIVKPDGSTQSFSKNDGKYKDSFEPYGPVKDKWIEAQVAAFLAARVGRFAAPPPPPKPGPEIRILAVRKSNTARDQWIEAIQWDCLTDRKYYIDVTPETKYHQYPFAGHMTVHVVAADNTVAFEAEAGTYWTPRTDGKYTFQLKFYQDKILGPGAADNYVSGLRIEWSLKSRKDL